MLAMLLFTALCSSSIPFTPQQDDLRSGYTPVGARSREEFARYEQFYAQKDAKGVGMAEGDKRTLTINSMVRRMEKNAVPGERKGGDNNDGSANPISMVTNEGGGGRLEGICPFEI